MTHPRPSQNVRAAMDAATSLNHWGAVVDILEGSAVGRCNQSAVNRVIRIAKMEMQRELKRMDAAVAKVNANASR